MFSTFFHCNNWHELKKEKQSFIWYTISYLFAAILTLLDWENMGPSHMPMMPCYQKTLVRHLEMQIYEHHSWLLYSYCFVTDIRAVLSSKPAESSEQGSNQTTKTPTLKRESNDSVLYSWVLFCWVQWNNELYFACTMHSLLHILLQFESNSSYIFPEV